jgi:hypothetical protein
MSGFIGQAASTLWKWESMPAGSHKCTVPRLVLKRPYFSDLWRAASVLGPLSSGPTLDTHRGGEEVNLSVVREGMPDKTTDQRQIVHALTKGAKRLEVCRYI